MSQGFVINIDEETENNTDFRRVLFTAPNSQLVVMNIGPGEEIGLETHEVDQFIRIEEGNALAVFNGKEYTVGEDWAVVIPAGTSHNIINTGSQALRLYTIYSPPEHPDGTVHKTKEEAEAAEKGNK